MKLKYWSANQLHPYLMVVVAIVAACCLYIVETYKREVPQENYDVKLTAAHTAIQAMNSIKQLRRDLGISINLSDDPNETGLIGEKETFITTDEGVLTSKQISTNPNIAALFTEWLYDVKLKKGDTIAIFMTGSFPALDISILSAVKAMDLKPIIIVSAASSSYGANIPDMTWLDMYMHLKESSVFTYPIAGASYGGTYIEDSKNRLSEKATTFLDGKIKSFNIPVISNKDINTNIHDTMALLHEKAAGESIKAYVNVGGGAPSIGRYPESDELSDEQLKVIENAGFSHGIILSMPVSMARTQSIALEFLRDGVPVVNVHNMKRIAEEHHIPMPTPYTEVGNGSQFFRLQYNIYLAIAGLVIIFLGLVWISRYVKHRVIAEAN